MPEYPGITFKNVLTENGIEHEKVSADIYIGANFIGQFLDDGWVDEGYIEYSSTDKQADLEKCLKEYAAQKGLHFPTLFDLIENLIKQHILRNKQFPGIKDDTLPDGYQLTFFE